MADTQKAGRAAPPMQSEWRPMTPWQFWAVPIGVLAAGLVLMLLLWRPA